MFPIYSLDSHKAYQDFFAENLLDYYPDPFAIPQKTWKVIVQFWYMDLSLTNQLMMDTYSKYGPMPRDPASMLRSYLLSIKLKVTSITDWVSKLKECPLYALISGFLPGDVPGVGTFYDFTDHLWLSDENNLTGHLKSKRVKTPKGKRPGEKTPNIHKTTAARHIRYYTSHHLPDASHSPIGLIFRLYEQQFLNVSVSKGLINPDGISLAGDGTPVRTSAHRRYKKVCDCAEKESLTVTAKSGTFSRTVIPDGIPTGNAISTATIFICLLLPIHTMTFRYFQCLNGPPGMIWYLFCIPFSR